MSIHPSEATKWTCTYKKTNGELCKRSVHAGEGRCWQHATWSRKWKTLTRNQAVLFVLAVLGIAVGLPSLYFFFVPSATDIKVNEILDIMKSRDEQQKLLAEYPLGYTIFDVNAVTGAVTPYQARQGLEHYEFDFRSVRIIENTSYRIVIQYPNVLKDGQLLLKAAVGSGDKNTMSMYGSGYVFSDGDLGVLASGRVLEYKGNQVFWVFGLRRVAPLHPPQSQ